MENLLGIFYKFLIRDYYALMPSFFTQKYDTTKVSDTQLTEPKISKPEYDIFDPESLSTTISPTPSPPSPRVKLIITDSIPPDLISIEDITTEEEE